MFKIISISLVALIIGIYLQLFGLRLPNQSTIAPNPEIQGFFWPKQKSLVEFEMVSHLNQSFEQKDLSGKWSFMFFGYTHCPDICPITMNTLRQARNMLLENENTSQLLLQFIFVSVDGERDTPELLDNYVSFFGKGFAGATGNKQQVDSLTGQLGVAYSIDDHAAGETDYLVNHTGAIFLISPEGNLASIFQSPYTASDISERFSRIIEFTRQNS